MATSTAEIHRRLGIAGSIMAQIDNVWRQQRLSLSTKLKIYTSLVQSVVLYGSETLTMRKVDRTGSARRVVHEEIGCNKWKKTLDYLLVLPGSRARIVRCGGRYDPQLVKRSSE